MLVVLVNQYLKKLKIILQSKYFLLLLILLIIIIFFIKNSLITRSSKYSSRDKVFAGYILNHKINGNKLTLTLVAKEKLICVYYIKSKEEKKFLISNLKEGIKIYIKGKLSRPINNTIPNTFNYKKYLYNQNIFYILNIEEYKLNPSNLSFLYKIKNFIQKRINKSIHSKEYLQMFILGNKNDLEEDIYINYQKLGITHLFAISGMHLSIFASVLLFFLKKIIKNEKEIFFIITIFLIFYTMLVSFSASILRALLSFIIFGINRIFKLKINSLNLMLLILLLVIIIDYKYLYNLGFQYSYLCSLGIILSNKMISKRKNYFYKLLIISFIVNLFSFPITAINFYEVNLFSIFSNLIFVPLISFIIYPICLLVILFPFFDNFLFILIKFMEWLSIISLKVFVFPIIIPKINYLFYLIYYILLYLFINKSKKAFIFIVVWIALVKLKPYLDYHNYVYYLDVGQGDCAIVKSAYNKELIMIDTGGKTIYKKQTWEESKENVSLVNSLIIFLKSIGNKKIDLLILTHGDQDHLGYAKYIIDLFKVKNILLNKGKTNELEKEIIKTKLVRKSYYSKNINFYIFNTKEYGNENDNSILNLFQINNYKFLFMGDVSKKVENDIINNYNFQVDFLKLGHHGSKTSSDPDFLSQVSPKFAIVSSGRNNRYNHPSPETVNALHLLDIDYYNTSEVGTIKIKIRQEDYTITTYDP